MTQRYFSSTRRTLRMRRIMAPPQIQCLNATRQIVKRSSGLRATFSTCHVFRADEPSSRRPSASGLLASLGDPSPSTYTPSSPSSPFSTPNSLAPFNNPIRLQKLQKLQPGNSNSVGNVSNLLRESGRREAERKARSTTPASADLDEYQRYNRAADLSKQITRRYKPGDVYAPHDLSGVEMTKWKKRDRPIYDVFDVLDMNPLEHYRNFSIMSEYMTPMGRIKHSKETGLRPVNQRRIARAIRRTIGMGLMPSVHRHPEILYKTAVRMNRQLSPSRGPSPL